MGEQKNRLDILLMADNGLETVGGEQESTKIIINGIKDHYSVGVIQPGEIKNPSENVIYFPMTKKTRIKHLIKNPFTFLGYIWEVKRIINEYHPKIIHTQSQVSFFVVSLLLKLKALKKQFIFVHTDRGLYINYNNFFKIIFKFFMRNLNVLITTTNFNLIHWRNAVKNNNKSLEYKVIGNTPGKIFETFNSSRKRKFIPDRKIVIGFAGRYSAQKNWSLAVKICEDLYKKIGNKLYVHMAVGCLDNKSIKQTKEMFDYLYGFMGENFVGRINIDLYEMDNFYYDIDFYLLTALPNSESFGRTIGEAMSRKTLVLTTNAGGPEEIIENKKDICKTSSEFINRILFYYQNPTIFKEQVTRNYKKVQSEYSLKLNIEKHLELYERYLLQKV